MPAAPSRATSARGAPPAARFAAPPRPGVVAPFESGPAPRRAALRDRSVAPRPRALPPWCAPLALVRGDRNRPPKRRRRLFGVRRCVLAPRQPAREEGSLRFGAARSDGEAARGGCEGREVSACGRVPREGRRVLRREDRRSGGAARDGFGGAERSTRPGVRRATPFDPFPLPDPSQSQPDAGPSPPLLLLLDGREAPGAEGCDGDQLAAAGRLEEPAAGGPRAILEFEGLEEAVEGDGDERGTAPEGGARDDRPSEPEDAFAGPEGAGPEGWRPWGPMPGDRLACGDALDVLDASEATRTHPRVASGPPDRPDAASLALRTSLPPPAPLSAALLRLSPLRLLGHIRGLISRGADGQKRGDRDQRPGRARAVASSPRSSAPATGAASGDAAREADPGAEAGFSTRSSPIGPVSPASSGAAGRPPSTRLELADAPAPAFPPLPQPGLATHVARVRDETRLEELSLLAHLSDWVYDVRTMRDRPGWDALGLCVVASSLDERGGGRGSGRDEPTRDGEPSLGGVAPSRASPRSIWTALSLRSSFPLLPRHFPGPIRHVVAVATAGALAFSLFGLASTRLSRFLAFRDVTRGATRAQREAARRELAQGREELGDAEEAEWVGEGRNGTDGGRAARQESEAGRALAFPNLRPIFEPVRSALAAAFAAARSLRNGAEPKGRNAACPEDASMALVTLQEASALERSCEAPRERNPGRRTTLETHASDADGPPEGQLAGEEASVRGEMQSDARPAPLLPGAPAKPRRFSFKLPFPSPFASNERQAGLVSPSASAVAPLVPSASSSPRPTAPAGGPRLPSSPLSSSAGSSRPPSPPLAPPALPVLAPALPSPRRALSLPAALPSALASLASAAQRRYDAVWRRRLFPRLRSYGSDEGDEACGWWSAEEEDAWEVEDDDDEVGEPWRVETARRAVESGGGGGWRRWAGWAGRVVGRRAAGPGGEAGPAPRPFDQAHLVVDGDAHSAPLSPALAPPSEALVEDRGPVVDGLPGANAGFAVDGLPGATDDLAAGARSPEAPGVDDSPFAAASSASPLALDHDASPQDAGTLRSASAPPTSAWPPFVPRSLDPPRPQPSKPAFSLSFPSLSPFRRHPPEHRRHPRRGDGDEAPAARTAADPALLRLSAPSAPPPRSARRGRTVRLPRPLAAPLPLPLPPSPTAWVAAEHAATRTLVIALQGSDSLEHWRINAACAPEPFERAGVRASVHAGVYAAARVLLPRVAPLVRTHVRERGPDARVALAGHSLGGAVAHCLALLLILRGELPPASLALAAAFGAPAAFCERSAGGPAGPRGAGDALLSRVGLSRRAFPTVCFPADVVPRLLSADAGRLSRLALRLAPALRGHPGMVGDGGALERWRKLREGGEAGTVGSPARSGAAGKGTGRGALERLRLAVRRRRRRRRFIYHHLGELLFLQTGRGAGDGGGLDGAALAAPLLRDPSGAASLDPSSHQAPVDSSSASPPQAPIGSSSPSPHQAPTDASSPSPSPASIGFPCASPHPSSTFPSLGPSPPLALPPASERLPPAEGLYALEATAGGDAALAAWLDRPSPLAVLLSRAALDGSLLRNHAPSGYAEAVRRAWAAGAGRVGDATAEP